MKGASKVPEWKKSTVAELIKLIDGSKVIAILNMENLPAKQLNTIRNKLGKKVKMKMAKKVLIERAIKGAKNKHAEKLLEHLKGMPALLFSDMNPFEIYKELKQNQSPAPAKVGQISPIDISVKAGLTNLTPGPAISTFAQAGVPAGVASGKIEIKQDKVLLKEGGVFTKQIIDILNLLGIEPMRIGINMTAALDGDTVFLKEVLDIDVNEYIANIKVAHSDAFKLAISAGIINTDTASFLIRQAELDAVKLAVSQNILNKETAAQILSRAEGQAISLKRLI